MVFALVCKFGRAVVWSAMALLIVAPGTHEASAADVVVYNSGASAEIVKGLAAKFSDATGRRILLTTGVIADIQQKLAAGEKPDIVILPTAAIEALEKRSVLRNGSRIGLARVGVGVAVRVGADRPEISSVEAIRKMLIEARSIVHPDPLGAGFAGAHIARMMAGLGIAETVKPKTAFMFAIGGGLDGVAKGDFEIGLFNISEILSAQGVTLVGPLPPELQGYIDFSGALHAGSASPEAATAFLRSLSDSKAREAWSAGGFEPLGP